MASNSPISNLPLTTLLSGDEMVPIVQGGTTKRVAAGQLAFLSTTQTINIQFLNVISNINTDTLVAVTSATISALSVSSGFGTVGASMETLIASSAAISHLSVSSNIGFYGALPITQPTITGSRSSNAALQSLISALAVLGLITDQSTV